MGIVNDNRCSFCQHVDETIVHLLWECIHVQTFMAEFKTMCRQITNNELEFSKADFIFGSQYIKPCINVTFIIATSYIFSCKTSESRPSIKAFRFFLKNWLSAKKYNAKKNDSIHKFKTIWSDFIILLEENLNTT